MYLWHALVVTPIVTLLFLTSNESNAAHSIALPQPTVKSAWQTSCWQEMIVGQVEMQLTRDVSCFEGKLQGINPTPVACILKLAVRDKTALRYL